MGNKGLLIGLGALAAGGTLWAFLRSRKAKAAPPLSGLVAIEVFSDVGGDLEVFTNRQFNAIAHYATGETFYVTNDPTLTWHSSDEAVASISSGGKVTGRAPGVVTIYATMSYLGTTVRSNEITLTVQETVLLATLDGRVLDSSMAPLAGVKVSIGQQMVTTDADGNYSFLFLSPGEQTIVFAKLGYQARSFNITLAGGDNSLGSTQLQAFSPAQFTTKLINYPSVNGFWQMVLVDQNGKSLVQDKIPLGSSILWNIPSDWVYPLMVDIGIYEWTGINTARQLWRLTSWSENSPDYLPLVIGSAEYNLTVDVAYQIKDYLGNVGDYPSLADWQADGSPVTTADFLVIIAGVPQYNVFSYVRGASRWSFAS